VPRADNLTTTCVVMKSGNFNFLEHSGPLQDCNGTALPIIILYYYSYQPEDSHMIDRNLSVITVSQNYIHNSNVYINSSEYSYFIFMTNARIMEHIKLTNCEIYENQNYLFRFIFVSEI
jgi:lysyl-tRNA synthetase class I